MQQQAGPARYRLLAIWGLPAAGGLLASVFIPRFPRPERLAFSAPRALRLAPWCALAFVADYSFLALGKSAGWLTLTYGDQHLYGSPGITSLWALPLSMVLGILGWERTLRRALLCAWSARVRVSVAVVLSCAVGVLFAVPSTLTGLATNDLPYTLAALMAVVSRELSCSLIFMSGGGILLAGLYRGWLAYLEGFVINDWSSLSFPAANYASSDPLFYLVRALSAILGAGVVAAGTWSAGRRDRATPR